LSPAALSLDGWNEPARRQFDLRAKEVSVAQKKDSPDRPRAAGGNEKSSGKGGGKSASGGAKVRAVAKNTSARREKASPSGRSRGETSAADRA
jgi:hypothetical protein